MPEERKLSTRNLSDMGDIGPLRRFTGILDSMPDEQRTFGDATKGEKVRTSTIINLMLKDIEVLEAIEPYHLPIFTIQVPLSGKNKSKWGVLGNSLNAVLDTQYTAEQLDPHNPAYVKPQDREDIGSCIGKRLGLVMADGDEGRPTPPNLWDGRAKEGKGGDAPTPTWMVYMVEGYGTAESARTSPEEKAMEVLDGKTQAQFNKEALADPVIREDTELLQSIGKPVSNPTSFTARMQSEGTFTKDKAGVFHRVEA